MVNEGLIRKLFGLEREALVKSGGGIISASLFGVG